MAIEIASICIDSHDPLALGGFWAEVLGWTYRQDDEGDVWVEPASGSPDGIGVRTLLFLPVPESKTLKNRIHLDLRPDDQAAEIERVVRMGAEPVSVGQDGTEDWVVLADPEGNEFCILREEREE